MVEKSVKIIKWLNTFERENDIENFKIGDLHLWPILRWSLAKDFLDKENLKSENVGSFSPKLSFFQNLKMYLVGAFFYLRLKLKLIKKATVLFSGASNYYEELEGERRNKLFYPLLEILKEHKIASLTGDYSANGKTTNSSRTDFPLVWAFNFYNKIIYPCKKKYFKEPVYLDAVFKSYQEEFGHQFNRKKFSRRIANTFKWAHFFELLISASETKYHFGICYYTPQMYGMNLACYRNNVTAIDMQHGPQGVLHPAYSGFQKTPEQGYSSFPRIFWCWDEGSANHLSDIFKDNKIYKSFKGGHPWIYFLEKHNKIKYINNENKVLLFSLQPLSEALPQIVFKAIANTPPGYIWWFRVHPRMSKEDTNEIKLRLGNYFRDGLVLFDQPTNLPLPTVLNSSYIHITQSSGCFLEATALGIPNLIVEETGYLYYKSLIDDKNNFCQTKGNLWQSIEKINQHFESRKRNIEDVERNLLKILHL